MKSTYIPRSELKSLFALMRPANRLALAVSVYTGLRIGDVLSLRVDQIKRHFPVKEQKTGKVRRVYLTDKLIAALRNNAVPLFPWCFPSPSDPRYHRTRQAVWSDVKRSARKLNLQGNISPHSMRKLYAVTLYRRKKDIEAVRKALNHDYYSTSVLYAFSDLL